MSADSSLHRRDEFAGLTALRAPLVWWVAVYHLAMPGAWLDPAGLWWPLANLLRSCLAVDIIFIFSGYLLARVYWNLEGDQVGRFARSRVARLLPMHLVGLLLCLPFVLAAGTYHPGLLPLVALLCACCLQAWIPSLALAINPPSWSIAAEAFFCACFPVFQPLMRRLTSATACLWWLGAAWMLAVIPCWILSRADPALAGLTLNQAWRSDGTVAHVVKYLPIIRLPEFVAGMLLCAWHRHRDWGGDGRLLVPLGAGLILGGVAMLAGVLPYAPAHNGLFLPAACLLIVGLADRRWSRTVLAHPRIARLGHASFSFFVLHTPMAMIAGSLAKRIPVLGAIPAPVFGILVLAATQVAAIAALRWLEEPLRQRLRSPLLPKAATA